MGGLRRWIAIQGSPGQKHKTLSKKLKQNGLGAMTQVVVHLPSKHEVLSSNYSTAKQHENHHHHHHENK
jgi:hypothetical protein